MVKTFTLVVAANPSAYSDRGGMWEGRCAGSVTAHYLHLLKQYTNGARKPGVFYSCGFHNTGLSKFIADFSEDERIQLIENFGKSINGVRISKYGYFYEPKANQSITWRFKAEGLKTYAEIDHKGLSAFLPYFKKYGIEEKRRADQLDNRRNDHHWLLITELERLKTPIKRQRGVLTEFTLFPNSGIPKKLKAERLQPNAYVQTRINPSVETKRSSFRSLMSDLLFDVLSGKEKLSEWHVHNAFLYHLMDEGCYIIDEGHVESGFFDVGYKTKKGSFIVVEFKLGEGNLRTLDQIENYVRDFARDMNIPQREIKRHIICKKATSNLIDELKRRGNLYNLTEYELNLNFDREVS